MFGYNPYHSPFLSPYSSYCEDSYSRSLAQEQASRYAARRRAEALRAARARQIASQYNSYLSGDDSDEYEPYGIPNTRARFNNQPMLEKHRQLDLEREKALLEAQSRATAQQMPQPQSSFSRYYDSKAPRPGSQPKPDVIRPSSPPHHPTTPPATAEQMEAASKIQAYYRSYLTRRKALAEIANIATRFETIKSTFVAPPKIDYQVDGAIKSVAISSPFNQIPSSESKTSSPKLAYTSNNTPIHAYNEEFNRLLSSLDEIESGGDQVVRERRKRLAHAIEIEAQRMEAWVSRVWEGRSSATFASRLQNPLDSKPSNHANEVFMGRS